MTLAQKLQADAEALARKYTTLHELNKSILDLEEQYRQAKTAFNEACVQFGFDAWLDDASSAKVYVVFDGRAVVKVMYNRDHDNNLEVELYRVEPNE